jgi:hypothetical protein
MSDLLSQHAIHDIIINVYNDFDKHTNSDAVKIYIKAEWETDPIPGISSVKVDIVKSKLLVGIDNIKKCYGDLGWEFPEGTNIFSKNSNDEYIAIYSYIELDLRQLVRQYVEMGSTPCEVILNLVDDGVNDSAILRTVREYVKDNYFDMHNVFIRSAGNIIFADKVPVENDPDLMVALDNMDLQQFQNNGE